MYKNLTHEITDAPILIAPVKYITWMHFNKKIIPILFCWLVKKNLTGIHAISYTVGFLLSCEGFIVLPFLVSLKAPGTHYTQDGMNQLIIS